MPGQTGSQLFDSPPHTLDIYLPDAPTTDPGGGVQLNWPATPSQAAAPCLISTSGSSRTMAQGQEENTVNSRIGFLSSVLQVTLIPGTKFVAPDTGRTLIMESFAPGRPSGYGASDIPAFTYVNAYEML